jgi:Ca2+-binding RTX toxin-like protein
LLGDSAADYDNSLEVIAGGSVISTASYGATVRGSRASIVNHGTIGGQVGAQVLGDYARIVNHGDIYSSRNAAVVMNSGSGAAGTAPTLFNYGTITSPNLAVNGDALFDDIVHNHGTMNGRVSQLGGNDTLVNRGTIVGDVELGADNDTFDNRGGTLEGTAFGNAGGDLFYAGASAEVLDGGADSDLLDFRASTGVTASLDNSLGGTGWALGDIYTNIESISGSNSGNDFLRGSNANNILYGNGGTDRLEGLAGNDIVHGGLGADTMAGGAGNDWFQYSAPTEGGDTILDFGNAAGNNDQFRLSAAGFGGGLVAGALAATRFQSRADNLAQDADDRFIFRTTDQTLWFDVNGNAAGGLTLIADCQAGTVLTAADIFMF